MKMRDKISADAMESEYINPGLDSDFAVTQEFLESVKNKAIKKFYHNQLLEYIKDLDLSGNILDIGERNPLTTRIEATYNISVDSTQGDLDTEFICPNKKYDVVIFNHVIEHLFNPLFCLENIKKVMKPKGILIIGTPIKPGFITTSKGHFHEMDDYRFRKLVKRAGLQILCWKKSHVYNNIQWTRFTGIRPLLRMFYKCHSWVTLSKQEQP